MRLKLALWFGLGAVLVGMTACGDPQRSTYVRYSPAPNFTSAPVSGN